MKMGLVVHVFGITLTGNIFGDYIQLYTTTKK